MPPGSVAAPYANPTPAETRCLVKVFRGGWKSASYQHHSPNGIHVTWSCRPKAVLVAF